MVRLIHLVRGDLDRIVVKCLEKDRSRRYDTAVGLAGDIKRYLNNEPITARPPSRAYRFQKLVRRNRLVFAAGILVVLVGLGVIYETNRQRRIATGILIRLHVANGTRLMNEGNLLGSLLPFAEALRLDAGSTKREEPHRIRIASVLSQSPKLVGVFEHEDSVNGGEFSPDGLRLITASDDHTARAWDLASGTNLFTLKHPGPVYSVAISPDSQLLVTTSTDGRVHFSNAGTGTPLDRPGVRHLSRWRRPYPQFSPDGRRLLTEVELTAAQLWDMASGNPIGAPLRHGSEISSYDFSPDGRMVVTVADEGQASVWDATTGEILFRCPPGTAVNCAAFSPDGRLLVTGGDDGFVRFWEVSSGRALASPLEHRTGVESVVFSPEGDRIATKCSDKSMQVWDPKARKALIPPITQNLQIFGIRFSPDGTRIVTTGANWLRTWNADTGELVVPMLRHSDWREPPTFSADGRLVMTMQQGEVRVWEIGRIEPQPLLIKPVEFFKERTVSPNGRFEARTLGDNSVGTSVGEYVVHYSDDQRKVIPIVYGRDIRNWWTVAHEPLTTRDSTLVWMGTNPGVQSQSKLLRLFASTWENPRPDQTVLSIDFISSMNAPAPFLVALTAD